MKKEAENYNLVSEEGTQDTFSQKHENDISDEEKSQREVDLILEIMLRQHGVSQEELMSYKKDSETVSSAASRMIQERHQAKKLTSFAEEKEVFRELSDQKETKKVQPIEKKEALAFWEHCLNQLSKEIPPLHMKTWVKPIRCERVGETLHLLAPNAPIAQWVKTRALSRITTIAEVFFGRSLEMMVRVDTPPAPTYQEMQKKVDLESSRERPIPKEEKVVKKENSVEVGSEKANLVHLPQCPNGTQGIPNALLRSALFSAIQSKNRQFFREAVSIFSIKGIEICFKGEQLDQTDLDVWQRLLSISREQVLGNKCIFNAHSLLKSLGYKKIGGKQYELFDKTISRLISAIVKISFNNKEYEGNLVYSKYKDKITKEYEISINPDIIKLFDAGWTKITFSDREQLNGKPLAQWLYGMYSSHAKPYPMKVSTIRELSGSSVKELFHFRPKLKNALTDLVNINFLKLWEIDKNDLVHVDRVL